LVSLIPPGKGEYGLLSEETGLATLGWLERKPPVFFFSFSRFFILHVVSYRLRVEANGIDTISFGQNGFPQQGLFLRFGKCSKTRITVLSFRLSVNG
jgi:hypothetical protein